MYRDLFSPSRQQYYALITFFLSPSHPDRLHYNYKLSLIYAMRLNLLSDLLAHQLNDLYHAEQQIIHDLIPMITVSSEPEIQSDFELHKQQSATHLERMKQIQQLAGIS